MSKLLKERVPYTSLREGLLLPPKTIVGMEQHFEDGPLLFSLRGNAPELCSFMTNHLPVSGDCSRLEPGCE
eukprot:5706489-Amphidinium_carterae.1